MNKRQKKKNAKKGTPIWYVLTKDKKVRPASSKEVKELVYRSYYSRGPIRARRVGAYKINGLYLSTVFLSGTVFLALEHDNWFGKPKLFESMIFPKGSWSDLFCLRYNNYAEALQGHNILRKKLKAGWTPSRRPNDLD